MAAQPRASVLAPVTRATSSDAESRTSTTDVVAFVTDPAKAREILEELRLPSKAPKAPETARARGPPQQAELFERPPDGFTPDPTYPDG